MTSAIANGASVVFVGLKAAVLNDGHGQCLGIDVESGRYKVKVTAPASLLALYPVPFRVKRENLRVLLPDMSSGVSIVTHDVSENGPPGPPSKNSYWSDGLSKLAAAEWFVDCYRLWIDDDNVWGGGDLRGLYNAEARQAGGVYGSAVILVDFLSSVSWLRVVMLCRRIGIGRFAWRALEACFATRLRRTTRGLSMAKRITSRLSWGGDRCDILRP